MIHDYVCVINFLLLIIIIINSPYFILVNMPYLILVIWLHSVLPSSISHIPHLGFQFLHKKIDVNINVNISMTT